MNETPEQLAQRAAEMRARGDNDPLTTRELAHARRVAARWEARARRAEEIIDMIADGMTDTNKHAPEDDHVAALCRMYGYGAVMDAAARLWARKDPTGAIAIGVCRGTIESVVRRRKER